MFPDLHRSQITEPYSPLAMNVVVDIYPSISKRQFLQPHYWIHFTPQMGGLCQGKNLTCYTMGFWL